MDPGRTERLVRLQLRDQWRRRIVGQQIHLLSPLVASTYLLVATAGVELGDHQRFTMKWALGACAVFMLTSLLLGLFPWYA